MLVSWYKILMSIKLQKGGKIMDKIVFQELKSIFALEIANKQKYSKNQIEVCLQDGTNAKIIVKNI